MPTPMPLAAIAASLLASCGGGAGPADPVVEGNGARTDPSGSWVLVDSEPTIDVPPDTRVTLTIAADGDAWEVSGTAVCNSYSGTVVTDGNTWRGDSFAVTEMGCDEPRQAAQEAYLAALPEVDTWTRPSTDELVLTGPDVELRYEALPPVPTAELTATTWVLDGLVDGDGPDASVSSTAPGADEATLRLEPDGTISAPTGCRAFSGEWTKSGDEILISRFDVRDDSPNVAADGTRTCDEPVAQQEDHVLSVLRDGFRAEITGEQLRVVSGDGLGLTYRARES